MRKSLLTASLVLAMAFAGCSGSPGPAGEVDDADGGARTSDGRTSDGGNRTDPPHDDVILLDAPVDLVGQDSQSFDVDVGANVTIVDFRIASPGPATELGGLRVELAGCGTYDMGTGSSRGSIGGSMSFVERLCTDASAGRHTLTVSNTGFVQGSIQLTGQVPKANATAA